MPEEQTPVTTPKPKKSVALSGVLAGNTALCTVGRTGNDLHYRGYDILDVAEQCEFEEIAHLLVHGKLPTVAELAAYKRKLRALRGIPAAVKDVLECIPASAHPMDVLRTACSALGAVLPEGEAHKLAEARDIAERRRTSSLQQGWPRVRGVCAVRSTANRPASSASMASGSAGFVRCASNPAASARWRSSFCPQPVIATRKRSPRGESRRSRAASSYPSMPSMPMSRNPASGVNRAASAMASSPL